MGKNYVFLISFACDWLVKVNTSSPYLLSSENIYFADPLVYKPHSIIDHFEDFFFFFFKAQMPKSSFSFQGMLMC